jgi:hypothetical protein
LAALPSIVPAEMLVVGVETIADGDAARSRAAARAAGCGVRNGAGAVSGAGAVAETLVRDT